PCAPTCSDGIKNGNETGIDCGGSCVPCTSGSSVLLSGNYFETGFEGWEDGGGDCYWYSGPYSPEGNSSIRIRDDSGEESAMTSPAYNLAPYSSVSFEFQFIADGMESGEDFWLLYFNGTSWINIGTFISGQNFYNDLLYSATVNLTGQLSSNAKFKLQCDASDNFDIVYIDAVIIKGNLGNGIFESPVVIKNLGKAKVIDDTNREKHLVVYPNPVENLINIKCNEDILKINIYNMAGQLIANPFINNDVQVDISGLTAGMYILSVETAENVYTERLVKK
ncbi:MAG: T9SS type A sorting domain-containing protein, partial [Saprospiraceae bacterium]